ncbi:hypothetical protein FH972_021411 [Carpinus fangiana]|uniref:Manganese/iron superoxide dismutase C-terminal domain-containing protein n=1 Tax=Carpinus fangiana TaxID=176857 RepID=A0A5N6KRF7_9ROSI|nr:hypothetical protein FH972_021411 [Carpinus fangiana]
MPSIAWVFLRQPFFANLAEPAMSARSSVRRVNGLLRTSRPLTVRPAPALGPRPTGLPLNRLSTDSTTQKSHTASAPPSSRIIQHVRSAHTMPSLGKWNDAITKEGVPGLYSPEGVDMAWTQYQQMMIDRLNHILAGDARENWDVKTLLLNTARNPATANTFNYASMAHNNHFFFRCLSAASGQPSAMPEHLERDLAASFSSIATLRDTLLTTAQAMFGPGFVWLVQMDAPPPSNPAGMRNAPQRVFKILSTYLAGSPYPQAHTRQQPRDMNTNNLTSADDYMRQTQYQNSAGAFGNHAAPASGMSSLGGGGTEDVRRFAGANCVPVLCVNTWEHAYLLDWGLKGKREFLEAWWDRIDWETVASHLVIKENRGFR